MCLFRCYRPRIKKKRVPVKWHHRWKRKRKETNSYAHASGRVKQGKRPTITQHETLLDPLKQTLLAACATAKSASVVYDAGSPERTTTDVVTGRVWGGSCAGAPRTSRGNYYQLSRCRWRMLENRALGKWPPPNTTAPWTARETWRFQTYCVARLPANRLRLVVCYDARFLFVSRTFTVHASKSDASDWHVKRPEIVLGRSF